MGKGNLKSDFTKLINDKRFLNVVVIALILAFVLLAISFLTTTRKKEDTESLSVNVESNSNLDEEVQKALDNYEENEKQTLKTLLNKIEDVGSVEVKINFKSGEVKIPATEETTRESITEETDSQGGTRATTQQDGGSKVVMAGDGSKNEPYILQVNKPEITGILIVAEGASSAKVKYDIQVAVSSLYGITIDKVNVYPMKK
ncbi:stage III sporulation protein AG [Clostridium sp. AL.422]|uniref:stage III sporulation protein AG n=1 Tax=Clostridium TaxID=1485 RepID=UPI00293DD1D3|nr:MULTISPECIES: stage III sporulation protein AG [unclassified Clostridium]MDV4152167.1 stage III sporulation protein AG [Clostridium sp. AL.422]